MRGQFPRYVFFIAYELSGSEAFTAAASAVLMNLFDKDQPGELGRLIGVIIGQLPWLAPLAVVSAAIYLRPILIEKCLTKWRSLLHSSFGFDEYASKQAGTAARVIETRNSATKTNVLMSICPVLPIPKELLGDPKNLLTYQLLWLARDGAPKSGLYNTMQTLRVKLKISDSEIGLIPDLSLRAVCLGLIVYGFFAFVFAALDPQVYWLCGTESGCALPILGSFTWPKPISISLKTLNEICLSIGLITLQVIVPFWVGVYFYERRSVFDDVRSRIGFLKVAPTQAILSLVMGVVFQLITVKLSKSYGETLDIFEYQRFFMIIGLAVVPIVLSRVYFGVNFCSYPKAIHALVPPFVGTLLSALVYVCFELICGQEWLGLYVHESVMTFYFVMVAIVVWSIISPERRAQVQGKKTSTTAAIA
jgi:hypothetical protein